MQNSNVLQCLSNAIIRNVRVPGGIVICCLLFAVCCLLFVVVVVAAGVVVVVVVVVVVALFVVCCLLFVCLLFVVLLQAATSCYPKEAIELAGATWLKLPIWKHWGRFLSYNGSCGKCQHKTTNNLWKAFWANCRLLQNRILSAEARLKI